MSCVFFDLDNTLTDRSETVAAYAKVFLQDFESHLQDGLNAEILGQLLNKLDAGGYGGHENRSRALIDRPIWRKPVSSDELIQHWQNWVPGHSVPMDGMHDCLQTLEESGYRMALVTNGSSQSQRTKISVLALASYFDACIISGEVGCAKPDSAIFNKAIEIMGCEPGASVFVGDHPVNDYQGSLACGMTPVWFEGRHIWPHIRPADFSVRKLSELPGVIHQILRSN